MSAREAFGDWVRDLLGTKRARYIPSLSVAAQTGHALVLEKRCHLPPDDAAWLAGVTISWAASAPARAVNPMTWAIEQPRFVTCWALAAPMTKKPNINQLRFERWLSEADPETGNAERWYEHTLEALRVIELPVPQLSWLSLYDIAAARAQPDFGQVMAREFYPNQPEPVHP